MIVCSSFFESQRSFWKNTRTAISDASDDAAAARVWISSAQVSINHCEVETSCVYLLLAGGERECTERKGNLDADLEILLDEIDLGRSVFEAIESADDNLGSKMLIQGDAAR